MRTLPLAALLAAGSPALAQSFTGVGAPAGGDSRVSALSADGSAAAGYADAAGSSAPTAFRWTQATGRLALPQPATTQGAVAASVSADGTIIAGSVLNSAGNWIAVRWYNPASPPQTVGTLPQGIFSYGLGISANGSVVVGGSDFAFSVGPMHGFRWASGTMQDIGKLNDMPETVAAAVADDGVTIAGWVDDLGGDTRAFRWTPAGGFLDLGGLEPGDDNSAAAISGDGSTIVGGSHGHAFVWTAAGGMLPLREAAGSLGTGATAVSLDGSVIGGSADLGTRPRAVYWDAQGIHDLETVLGPALPTGWQLRSVTAVSRDGRALGGEGLHNGVVEGWVARPGAPCYANCDGSTVPPILNVSDFTCFLNKYAAGDTYANCDGSSIPPILNVSDFICYLNRYSAGCP